MNIELKRAALVMAMALIIALPAAADDAISWVPADAAIVGMVDVEDWRYSEATRRMFDKTSEITMDGDLEELIAETGLDPRTDIDVIVVAVRPDKLDSDESQVLVLAEGRFEPARLDAAVSKLSDELQTRSINDINYFVGTEEDEHGDVESFAVVFLNESLVMAGTTELVEASLRGETRRNFLGASPLGRELNRISDDASAWLLADVPRAGRIGKSIGTELGEKANFGSAFRYVSTLGFWATERDGNLALGGLAVSSDGETLELIGDALRGMTAAWRLAVRDQKPEWIPAVRSFEVGNNSDSVWISGSIPIDLLRSEQEQLADGR